MVDYIGAEMWTVVEVRLRRMENRTMMNKKYCLHNIYCTMTGMKGMIWLFLIMFSRKGVDRLGCGIRGELI